MDKKVILEKACPNSAGTNPRPNKTSNQKQYDRDPNKCSLPNTVIQTVTTSYSVAQYSLIIILKELAKTKQANRQLKRNTQPAQTGPNQAPQKAFLPVA